MRCSKCKGLLVEFSEGLLNGKLSREIRKHISACASCRQDLAALRSSLRLIDDAKRLERIPEPPAEFAKRVIDRVRQNATTAGIRSALPRKLALGFVSLCCLLALGAMLLLYGRSSERRNVSPDAAFVEIEPESPDDAGRMPALTTVDIGPLYQVKMHIGMELVRLLEQTLEVIERGERKWEVEI